MLWIIILMEKGVESDHKVIKGCLTLPLPVGQKHAMIKLPDGTVKSFPVRPLVKSEVAAIPFDTEGLFQIDEANKIASATLTKDVVVSNREVGIGDPHPK